MHAGQRPRWQSWKSIGLLGVALRAKPRDTAVSVHPVVRVGLALQARDFSGLGARIFSQDIPVVLCVSDDFEGHFCFCHAPLCTQFAQKRTRVSAARVLYGPVCPSRAVTFRTYSTRALRQSWANGGSRNVFGRRSDRSGDHVLRADRVIHAQPAASVGSGRWLAREHWGVEMILVTGSILAREESFHDVRRSSLEHVERSRKEPRLYFPRRARRLPKSLVLFLLRAMGG
jgi:hypothetical protein